MCWFIFKTQLIHYILPKLQLFIVFSSYFIFFASTSLWKKQGPSTEYPSTVPRATRFRPTCRNPQCRRSREATGLPRMRSRSWGGKTLGVAPVGIQTKYDLGMLITYYEWWFSIAMLVYQRVPFYLFGGYISSFWVNYNISLPWIKAIGDDFPYLIWFQWGRREVVVIYPDVVIWKFPKWGYSTQSHHGFQN